MLYVANLPQFVAVDAAEEAKVFCLLQMIAGLRKVNWAVSRVFGWHFCANSGKSIPPRIFADLFAETL